MPVRFAVRCGIAPFSGSIEIGTEYTFRVPVLQYRLQAS
jgi:hypothetical protein